MTTLTRARNLPLVLDEACLVSFANGISATAPPNSAADGPARLRCLGSTPILFGSLRLQPDRVHNR
jgi:hypothetical protein